MSYYNQQQPPVGVPPPQGYPPEGYPPKDAYPPPGYPPQGYPQGYPQQGYPPQGYPPQYAQPPPPQQKQSSGFVEVLFSANNFLSVLEKVWLLFAVAVFWMLVFDDLFSNGSLEKY
ncbi:hypothetical protein GOBAR_DD25060 [Gossypium barbadense]|nr:hypothetical protein GOBAR_DD25060 [Gossypium barbadense]